MWTAADDDAIREIYARIPGPVLHWFWVSCPRCGHRVWNQMCTQWIYESHFMGHLIDDMRAEREVA